jgi:hypothetical protein
MDRQFVQSIDWWSDAVSSIRYDASFDVECMI